MSKILIYSQSLQNDGNDCLLCNGKYRRGFSQDLNWTAVTEQLNKLKKNFPTMDLDKKTSVSYRNTRNGFYFIIPSEQVDNENRPAIISIFCPREETDNLEQELDVFLKGSGLSVCQGVRAFVKKEIKNWNRAVTDSYSLSDLIKGVAILLGGSYLAKKLTEKKDEPNK